MSNKEFETESLLNSSEKLINMSPDSISPEELLIEVNGVNSEITLTLSRYNFLKYGIYDPKRKDLKPLCHIQKNMTEKEYLK